MTKEQKLNAIFDQTKDDFTGLLKGLNEDEYIELAKAKVCPRLTALKDALSKLSASLKGVII